jgi:SAM-dependent methyltransferase
MPRRLPILTALLAQGLALLGMALGVWIVARFGGLRLPLAAVVALQAALATLLGARLGLARGWLWFQALFVPALIGLHALDLPSWVHLAAFLAVLLLNWNSFRHGVPLYLTSRLATRRLADFLRDRPSAFTMIDLGCGLGGTLVRLARLYPRAHFTGVETAPLTFVFAWLRSLPVPNCRIRYRSLWQESLAPYDVVYCFLSPIPMAAIGRKARAELRPGALLVSNTFGIPGATPDREIALGDWRGTRLLVWQTPAPAAPVPA